MSVRSHGGATGGATGGAVGVTDGESLFSCVGLSDLSPSAQSIAYFSFVDSLSPDLSSPSFSLSVLESDVLWDHVYAFASPVFPSKSGPFDLS